MNATPAFHNFRGNSSLELLDKCLEDLNLTMAQDYPAISWQEEIFYDIGNSLAEASSSPERFESIRCNWLFGVFGREFVRLRRVALLDELIAATKALAQTIIDIDSARNQLGLVGEHLELRLLLAMRLTTAGDKLRYAEAEIEKRAAGRQPNGRLVGHHSEDTLLAPDIDCSHAALVDLVKRLSNATVNWRRFDARGGQVAPLSSLKVDLLPTKNTGSPHINQVWSDLKLTQSALRQLNIFGEHFKHFNQGNKNVYGTVDFLKGRYVEKVALDMVASEEARRKQLLQTTILGNEALLALHTSADRLYLSLKAAVVAQEQKLLVFNLHTADRGFGLRLLSLTFLMAECTLAQALQAVQQSNFPMADAIKAATYTNKDLSDCLTLCQKVVSRKGLLV